MATFSERYQSEITLNGQTYKTIHSLSTTSITDIFDRIIGVSSGTAATLLQIGTDQGAVMASCNYFYIENLDATNFVTVQFMTTGADAFAVKVPAGQKFIMPGLSFDVGTSGSTTVSLGSWDRVYAKADTAEVLCHVVAVD